MSRNAPTRIRAALALIVLFSSGGTAALTAGCADPLLSPREERSPFDRYDNVRNRYAQQYIENEYGRREPNLRGRLSPKD